MGKYIAGIVLVVLVIAGGIYLLSSTSTILSDPPTTGVLKKGVKLAHFHEKPTNKGKVIVGDPQSTEKNLLKPRLALTKWDNEVNLGISYDIGSQKGEAIDGGIVWKGDGRDLIYKEVKAQQPTEQSILPKKPVIRLAASTNDVRYIKFGATDLTTIASSYELFENESSPDPTITTYVPNEDGYFFFGYKNADKDLKNPRDITYPIVRLKADMDSFSCPVIPFTKNGGFVVRFYKPNLIKDGELYRGRFVEAINNALKKEGVDKKIERKIDFLYYMDGIRPVQIGRIGYDTNNLIFYLYTDSPLNGSPLQDNLRVQLLLRDTLFPFSDLKSLKSTLTPDFQDKIVEEFLKLSNFNGIQDSLSPDEDALLRGLKGLQKEESWKFDATRSDLPNRITDQDQFDKFEFDILLREKPDNNVFTYKIETEGLDFFYQPELSEEEKERGSYQPENVVGSYAVYKKDSNPLYDNPVDAEKYKTGKVMHIYRPKVIDDKGDWIWGDLHVDPEKGTLTVTVDKNWLEKAAYPVLVDPTFGYTSAGAILGTLSNEIKGNSYTIPTGGTLTQISIFGGDPCFTGDTYVTMADGSLKKIKEIRPKDIVKTYSKDYDKLSTNKVVRVFKHDPQAMEEYYLQIFTDDGRDVGITPNHPVYKNGTWIAANYLRTGDILMGDKMQDLRIIKINKIYEKVTTYTLEVDENSNFFTNFLVHNKKGNEFVKTAIFESNNLLLADTIAYNTFGSYGRYDFPANASLLAGSSYWLYAWGMSGSDLSYDSGGGNGVNKSVTYATEWPDPLTGITTDNNKYSIFATYSAEEPKVQYQINSSGDDFEIQEVNFGGPVYTLTSNNTTHSVGHTGTNGLTSRHVGYRFSNINIPSGGVIRSAYLILTLNSGGSNHTIKIDAEKSQSPISPTTYSDFSSRIRTSSNVNWSNPSGSTTLGGGTSVESPNIGSIIQELVDMGSQSSFIIFLNDIQGGDNTLLTTLRTYDHAPASAAKLDIYYTVGGPANLRGEMNLRGGVNLR